MTRVLYASVLAIGYLNRRVSLPTSITVNEIVCAARIFLKHRVLANRDQR